MNEKGELILHIGAEGGSISLYRYVNANGDQWFYKTINDALLHDLMIGEDLGPSGNTSGSVATLQEAFGLLDSNRWARLHVLDVHPDIAAEVWAAVQARLAQEREYKDFVLDRWAKFCGVQRPRPSAPTADNPTGRALTFIFVRHGKAVSKKGMKIDKERDGRGLTVAGIEEARQAGEFLKKVGIKPDFVITTNKRRTIDTGDVVRKILGVEEPPMKVRSGFKINESRSGILKCLGEWMKKGKVEPRELLFVGHEVQQKALVKAAGGTPKIPKDQHGVVLVYDIDERGAWTEAFHFVGD